MVRLLGDASLGRAADFSSAILQLRKHDAGTTVLAIAVSTFCASYARRSTTRTGTPSFGPRVSSGAVDTRGSGNRSKR